MKKYFYQSVGIFISLFMLLNTAAFAFKAPEYLPWVKTIDSRLSSFKKNFNPSLSFLETINNCEEFKKIARVYS